MQVLYQLSYSPGTMPRTLQRGTQTAYRLTDVPSHRPGTPPGGDPPSIPVLER